MAAATSTVSTTLHPALVNAILPAAYAARVAPGSASEPQRLVRIAVQQSALLAEIQDCGAS